MSTQRLSFRNMAGVPPCTCASCGERQQHAFSKKQRARSHFATLPASQIQIATTEHNRTRQKHRRWKNFVLNGRQHVGQKQRTFLCQACAPVQVQNQNANQCANFQLTQCTGQVTSPTQLRKRVGNRYCERCKQLRSYILRFSQDTFCNGQCTYDICPHQLLFGTLYMSQS